MPDMLPVLAIKKKAVSENQKDIQNNHVSECKIIAIGIECCFTVLMFS